MQRPKAQVSLISRPGAARTPPILFRTCFDVWCGEERGALRERSTLRFCSLIAALEMSKLESPDFHQGGVAGFTFIIRAPGPSMPRSTTTSPSRIGSAPTPLAKRHPSDARCSITPCQRAGRAAADRDHRGGVNRISPPPASRPHGFADAWHVRAPVPRRWRAPELTIAPGCALDRLVRCRLARRWRLSSCWPLGSASRAFRGSSGYKRLIDQLGRSTAAPAEVARFGASHRAREHSFGIRRRHRLGPSSNRCSF